ncbi:translation elongation factor Ts [Deferribacterales bacterium RsTz2092]|nr:elongation factor Ts [Deferribacterales bacterium]
MAEISASIVKDLREKTGTGMMDCKKALVEVGGDFDKAVEYLRKKGLSDAAKKSSRVAADGRVHAYIHGDGRIGVLVEVNCETDFVAKTPEFQELCNDIALQICGNNPIAISEDDITPALLVKEQEIYTAKAKESGKPDNIIAKIVDGQMNKFKAESALLSQPFLKNPDITVNEHLVNKIAKIGEKISIRRFVRYQLGEGIEKVAGDFVSEVMAQVGQANQR